MKMICIGRNYAKHIEELGNPKNTEPLLFLKPKSALLETTTFIFPEFSKNIRYEVEVLLKIDKTAKNISPQQAEQHYSEIGLGIDFTAVDIQEICKQKGWSWEKAKAFDGSAVVGKFMQKKYLPPVNELTFYLEKNGKVVQEGNTANTLWKPNELTAYASRFFTLEKGDILFTGTPAGVGGIYSGDILRGFLEKQRMFEIDIR